MMPPGTFGASSFYDTTPLRATLFELVDFERLNNGPVRLSVGAVNVETGNIVFFDSDDREIGPEHIMASGALPPGFPAIEIDGAHYWDGGLVSNTPLQYILDEARQSDDLCIFQIDLFNARGALPDSVWTTESREKDIRFSSRTRFNTDMMARLHAMRLAARKLYDKLPPDLRDDPDVRDLVSDEMRPAITVAHLIYRQAKYERQSRDYEFSRTSMPAHWDAGAHDVETSLAHPAWQARKPKRDGGIQVFDLTRDEP
jgi:NTE family protein